MSETELKRFVGDFWNVEEGFAAETAFIDALARTTREEVVK